MGEANTTAEVADRVAQPISGGSRGANSAGGDVPMAQPVNYTRQNLYAPDPKDGPLNWSSGCLFKGGTSEYVDGCTGPIREPGAGISMKAAGGSNNGIDHTGGTPQPDMLGFTYMPVRSYAASLNAFVSTRTKYRLSTDMATISGKHGCLMARESTASGSPFAAVCRYGHSNSRNADGVNEGAYLLYRTEFGGRTKSFYYSNPFSDTLGASEVQNYFNLYHDSEGSCWYGGIRVTDDPAARAGELGSNWAPVSLNQIDPALQGRGICFSAPLKLIGFATDGGTRQDESWIGEYFFANAKYDSGIVTANQLSTVGIGSASSVSIGDRSFSADGTAPATTFRTQVMKNGFVEANIQAWDNSGGAGVNHITYEVSGATVLSRRDQRAEFGTAKASLLLTRRGLTTINVFAADNAGNVELWKSFQVNVKEGTYDSVSSASIPDDGTLSAESVIDVPSSVRAKAKYAVHVNVNINHFYRGQLEIYIITPTGVRQRLKKADLSDRAVGVNETYTISTLTGKRAGRWRLVVRDVAQGTQGTLDNWSVTFPKA
ncbi:proprotein convertase P-domain-containing protein [Streptomyces virginiae]|uniref:proprotein convertase P-domain-containing protein n=1 Tax=Streptomyces virginiae TaxID=1961 RepID=UPI00200DA0CB|nr:proprotein convertase P-domain-containing protein [Streptomyces virginiae]